MILVWVAAVTLVGEFGVEQEEGAGVVIDTGELISDVALIEPGRASIAVVVMRFGTGCSA